MVNIYKTIIVLLLTVLGTLCIIMLDCNELQIRSVYYPGLASHPEHHLAKKQMTGFGGVVSFEVSGYKYTAKGFPIPSFFLKQSL